MRKSVIVTQEFPYCFPQSGYKYIPIGTVCLRIRLQSGYKYIPIGIVCLRIGFQSGYKYLPIGIVCLTTTPLFLRLKNNLLKINTHITTVQIHTVQLQTEHIKIHYNIIQLLITTTAFNNYLFVMINITACLLFPLKRC